MKVTVEFADSLADLVADVAVAADGEPITLELPDGAVLGDAMNALGIDEARALMVIANGRVVVKSARPTHQLEDGDEIQILPPLKGG